MYDWGHKNPCMQFCFVNLFHVCVYNATGIHVCAPPILNPIILYMFGCLPFARAKCFSTLRDLNFVKGHVPIARQQGISNYPKNSFKAVI